MDDFIRFSRFVVITTGDGKHAHEVAGWEAMISYVRECLWFGEPNQPEWDETVAAISDPSNWESDEYGSWCYRESYEDGGLNIYRLDD